MIASPRTAVRNMKRCELSSKDNWLRRHRFRLVTNFLNYNSATNLLDFGCGDGLFLKYLQKHDRSLSVTGYDPYYVSDWSSSKVKIFNSISDIIYRQFDIVCALEVIEHIEDDEQALLQIHKLLKPRGTLLLTVPSYQILYSRLDAALGHYRRYNRSNITQLLKKTGYIVQHSTYFLSFLIPFSFVVKYYSQASRIWHKDPILNLPADPLNIFSMLSNIEHKLMHKTDFQLPFGTAIFVSAHKKE